MEARSDLDQSGDPASGEHGTGIGREHPGDELEHRRLAGTVVSQQGDGFADSDLERDAVERVEIGRQGLAPHGGERRLLDGVRMPELEVLVDVVDDDAGQQGCVRGLGQNDPPVGGRRAGRWPGR